VEKNGRARQTTDGNIIQRMHIACWIINPTYAHSEYVIRAAFPRQQKLHEHTCTSMSRL
jgi:hypothetical protein